LRYDHLPEIGWNIDMKKKLNNWKILVGLILLGIVIAAGLFIVMIDDKEPEISLGTDSVTLSIGDTWVIPIEVEKGMSMPEVSYKSANASIASVDKSGKIKALREGETVISCTTAGGQRRTVPVIVAAELTDGKTIYLTYEDGPSRDVTPRLLALLGEYKAKASFFPYGQEAEAYSEPVSQAVSEGHTVGVHTYSPDYSSIYESVPAFIKDFNKTEKVIRKVTGQKPEYWRFPGGSINDNITREDKEVILTELHGKGYVCVDWTCYTDDLSDTEHDADTMTKTAYRTIDQAISMGQVPVVRLHDSTDNGQTLKVTENILKHYGKKGYAFKALSDYRKGDIIAGE
jgi:peptidoglycan/xylan/chitin deacetylase (PgdA/CDA1 family)